jgi:threonine dehydratase
MTVSTSEPTFADVLQAAERLAPVLPPTPMWNYPALDAAAGATLHIKHENCQPTGAFKVRGGLNYFASLPDDERERGVVTYSTGNHAQSIAYAAGRAGATCVVVMPEGTNSIKARAVEALGGQVEFHGSALGEACKHAEAIAAERGLRLISPGDEAALITGVATLYREILAAREGIDALVVPIGSGSGAAAACLAAEGLGSSVEVVGVQSAASPTAHDSWHARELVVRPNTTAVEGLATGSAFELPQRIMWRRMNDFILVSDEQIAEARRMYATHAHTLAEGAGAAALAAVFADDRFRGRRVAVVCSGANASPQEIATLSPAA